MGKNSKPILSVLVDEDKKEKFADIARRHKYSMGWLVNNCIDRMIEADSIDIYRDLIGDMSNTPTLNNAGLSTNDIEEIVKSYIPAYLNTSSIGINDVAELIRTSIEPISESVTELETYTQNQFIAVREELKKALSGGVASPTENRVTPDTIAKPVQVEVNLPSAKSKPEGEPDWVNSDNRRFYLRLIEDSELLSKVTEAIARNPKDNTALSKSLVELGFHRKDGTGYDSASISRIKNVVNRLNTSPSLDSRSLGG
jgi:hypothetical protein